MAADKCDGESQSAETGQSLSSSSATSSPSADAGPITFPPKIRWMFRLWDMCAIGFWLYVISKVFFIDIDVIVAQRLFPAQAWLLNLKFVLILASLAIALVIFDKISVLLWCLNVVFYPLILVLWKIPRLIYKRRSWVVAFAFANALISFFTSFKYNILMSTSLLLATAIIFISASKPLLWIAIVLLLVSLYAGYVRRFVSAVRPTNVFRLHGKLISWLGGVVASSSIPDPAAEGTPFADLTEQQVQQWTVNLQNSVLVSRFCLFFARKLKQYQTSGVGFYSAAFVVLFLVLITISVFAIANMGLCKIDPNYFSASHVPSLFTFIYYSFKTVVFGEIAELSPAAIPSKVLWMLEAGSALFFALIFASLMFSARNQRQTEELNKAIETISEQGRSLELVVLDRYKFSNMDEALSELTRLKAAFVSFIYKLS